MVKLPDTLCRPPQQLPNKHQLGLTILPLDI